MRQKDVEDETQQVDTSLTGQVGNQNILRHQKGLES